MLHPAACLLSWLIMLAALQFLAWPALLAIGTLLALAGGDVRRRWWRLLRRARWLLLSLWLILAYGSPGEALFDLPWAPTDAGAIDAGLHVLRLVLMLGSLAWLFERLPQDRLLAGLWVVARPLGALGLDVNRLVVRLSLVFDLVQEAPRKGSWRQFLDEPPSGVDGAATVRLELPLWRMPDSGLLLGVALLLAAACWLS